MTNGGRGLKGVPGCGPGLAGTAGLPITDVLGSTPRERLAWLLEFGYLNIQSIDRGAHLRLWGLLAGLVKDATRGRWRVPDSEKPEREAFRLLKSGVPYESEKDPWYPGRLDHIQAWVRHGITSLGNIHHIRDVEIVYFEPFPGGPPLSPHLKSVLRDFHFQVGLPDGVMVALAQLRHEVPASVVRQCHWVTDGGCGRFFVATKRQKWCPLHQDAARRERDRRAQERLRERRAQVKVPEDLEEEGSEEVLAPKTPRAPASNSVGRAGEQGTLLGDRR